LEVRRPIQWWIPAAALAVLAAMEGWKLTLPALESGEPFRKKVKSQLAGFRLIVGDWSGTERPLPEEAIALLHPNVSLSREYVNVLTKETVGFMFIEVEDARDMMGHYPPNCYPGNGWKPVGAAPACNAVDREAVWVVGDLRIKGTEYEFTKTEKDGNERKLWVRSFFILPNDTFYPEIASFNRAASDFYIRPFGATQVQVIYDREYLPEDRERIFQDVIGAHRDLIEAVRKKD
jgi:hypothetical protein